MAFVAHDWVAYHADHRPDAPALGSADDSTMQTWAQLEDRVGRLARVLRTRGVGKGDRILVIAENDPRLFEIQFAAMRIGAVLTPVNWRLAVREMIDIAIDADPRLIIHDTHWAEVAHAVADRAAVPQRLSWASDDSEYDRAVAAAEYLAPSGNLTFDDTTHILYTSGTTGLPKGVLSTHGTLVWHALNTAQTTRFSEPGNHHLNPMPLFHAGGLNVMANPIMYFGGAVSTMRRFAPEPVLNALTRAEVPVTHFAAIPLMYRGISTRQAFGGADFSNARQFIVAGAIAEPELLQIWADRGVLLQPQYGGTEHGPMATALDYSTAEPMAAFAKAKAGSTGKAARHTQIRLVDQDGNDVPDGRTGEIWLRGPSVTPGYWNRNTEDYFTDGWYRTGDGARRDADGYYYLSGRVKEMFKSGGENVYPAEIERILCVHPKVADVAVIGIAHEVWGETGMAVVVPATPHDPPTLEELNEFAGPRLARFKLPKALTVVPELPRNATGKVSRSELKQQYCGVRV
ncbi:MAG: AMP-binding protein [Actinomycetota bacterium]|nr:AMP-binding protein [Actinomycetota bacterium]